MLKKEARWEMRIINRDLRGRHPNACIDGSPCKESNRVAYCWCDWHRGFLTSNLIKKQHCLKKNCGALQKLPNHYWDRREKAKSDRRKQAEIKRHDERRDAGFLMRARDYARDNYVDSIYITTAKLIRPGLIRITFIGAYAPGLYGLDEHMRTVTRCRIWIQRAKADKSIRQALIPSEQ